MKLKRILSLALCGVLAVSMLTACGGGSSISKLLNDRTSTVRSALNGAQSMMSYKSSDSKLDDAVAKVAESLTSTQIANGVDNSSVSTTVRQLTGYTDMGLGGAWKAETTVGSKTFVKVFVYNVDNEAFDTATEVAEDMAKKLDVMQLKSEDATKGANVTNAYKGNVVAYEKTIGEGDSAFNAWVVGVSITQTVTANK